MFEQGEKLQKKIVSLFTIFSNKLDDLVNSSNEEYVISCSQNRNITSLWLPTIGGNRVASSFKVEKRIIKKNRVASCFQMKKEIEDANKDMFEVSFLYWGIIIFNWQKIKRTRF